MTTALIGHSGFVGETLKQQHAFDALFRSTDIGEIAGRTFDRIVCAAAPAAKWKANRDPEGDWRGIQALLGNLERVACRQLILISTVDVYSTPALADESVPVVPTVANAYGRHRYLLEEFCRTRFDATVVRLPALFGRGLRKNAIFDLLNDNAVEALQPESEFQYYDMSLLWSDLERILVAEHRLVNLVTEPVRLGDVAASVFGRTLPPNLAVPAVRYDLRTVHADLWGRRDGYAYGSTEVLAGLQRYVDAERGGGRR
ncbi:MAG: NAD(P)-dependent oxidoreductase [Anaeromyxobacter sp.]|nr:NAD(P)-dependent oxidoreductase [Anaeromyxobacter sp.]